MKKYNDDTLKEAKELVDSFDEWISSDLPETTLDPNLESKMKSDKDYQFDTNFNESIRSRYYQPEDQFWGSAFWYFEQNINGLYLYYQYLRRFINYYVGEALKHYEHQRDVADAASGMQRSVDFWDYEEEIDTTESINQIEYENIVMALYRVFEKFLKEYIQENDPNSPVLRESKGDHTVLNYMNYLRKQNIFFPKKLYDEFTKEL